jgi:undecaprenyl diphosphate synthase
MEPESPRRIPQHVAIIMDGNGRWAKSRGLPRLEGHRAGAKSVRAVIEESRKLGVKHLTLYAFSSENWGRPQSEVEGLMGLFTYYLEHEAKALRDNGVRLRAIGRRETLSEKVQASLARCEAITAEGCELNLYLAVSYGGRDELVDAVKSISNQVRAGTLDEQAITAETIQRSLYAPNAPDPELLIRTSSECRVSNFLLWQIAYSEIIITDKFWPDFDSNEYNRCIDLYNKRTRRFGLTDEQRTSTEKP